MNKFTYWAEEEDGSRREMFLNSIESFDQLFISYLSLEPHAFLHAGTMLQKHPASFENKEVLSIGLDICKEVILLKANTQRITVIDTDKSAMDCAQALANKIVKDQKIEYVVGDARDLNIKKSYDTVLLSQMDYCLTDEAYSSLLAHFGKVGIEEVIILTPSLYEFSTNPYKIIEAIEFFLGAIKRMIIRGKYSSPTYRRKKSYFETLISERYEIVDHFDYRYPSGREHLYRLIKR